jgi:hypothetical protein
MAKWWFLPEILRHSPARPVAVSFRVFAPGPVGVEPDVFERHLAELGLRPSRRSEGRWHVPFDSKTMVYGAIRRDVDETVEIAVVTRPDGGELLCSCLPIQTHNAHAAGAGGAIAAGALVWVVGGWMAGAAPGITTTVAGLLLADGARELAMAALERRLGEMAADIGSMLWPELPTQVTRQTFAG